MGYMEQDHTFETEGQHTHDALSSSTHASAATSSSPTSHPIPSAPPIVGTGIPQDPAFMAQVQALYQKRMFEIEATRRQKHAEVCVEQALEMSQILGRPLTEDELAVATGQISIDGFLGEDAGAFKKAFGLEPNDNPNLVGERLLEQHTPQKNAIPQKPYNPDYHGPRCFHCEGEIDPLSEWRIAGLPECKTEDNERMWAHRECYYEWEKDKDIAECPCGNGHRGVNYAMPHPDEKQNPHKRLLDLAAKLTPEDRAAMNEAYASLFPHNMPQDVVDWLLHEYQFHHFDAKAQSSWNTEKGYLNPADGLARWVYNGRREVVPSVAFGLLLMSIKFDLPLARLELAIREHSLLDKNTSGLIPSILQHYAQRPGLQYLFPLLRNLSVTTVRDALMLSSEALDHLVGPLGPRAGWQTETATTVAAWAEHLPALLPPVLAYWVQAHREDRFRDGDYHRSRSNEPYTGKTCPHARDIKLIFQALHHHPELQGEYQRWLQQPDQRSLLARYQAYLPGRSVGQALQISLLSVLFEKLYHQVMPSKPQEKSERRVYTAPGGTLEKYHPEDMQATVDALFELLRCLDTCANTSQPLLEAQKQGANVVQQAATFIEKKAGLLGGLKKAWSGGPHHPQVDAEFLRSLQSILTLQAPTSAPKGAYQFFQEPAHCEPTQALRWLRGELTARPAAQAKNAAPDCSDDERHSTNSNQYSSHDERRDSDSDISSAGGSPHTQRHPWFHAGQALQVLDLPCSSGSSADAPPREPDAWAWRKQQEEDFLPSAPPMEAVDTPPQAALRPTP